MSSETPAPLHRQQTMLFSGNLKPNTHTSGRSKHFKIHERPSTLLGHTASLNIDDLAYSGKRVRKTSIICTIGPKTNSIEMLCALRKAGMTVVRLNFSHGSYEVYFSIFLH